ncbi:MAG: glycosyltransferase family 4 protein, partial [Candidatus Krumholzibacteria bacterium]|nr:glycosyltransferase family 4 protein [Candidatus Krumholzibacteria bacterium]
VGEGEERRKLAGLAEELGISSCLALPGLSDSPEDFYPLFDLFVVPSLTETGPMVLQEAMAAGVACVASDVGCAGEFMGETGVVVQPGDEDGFLGAVSKLLVDEELRRELGRRARVRIMENYDIDIWGDRILEIYRSILEKHSVG